jgi:cytochrome b561
MESWTPPAFCRFRTSGERLPDRVGTGALARHLWRIIAQTVPPPESPAVYSSVMAKVAQIIIWAVVLVLGVLAYWRYLRLAPMD